MSAVAKLRKLVRNPGVYFRDMLLKRHPLPPKAIPAKPEPRTRVAAQFNTPLGAAKALSLGYTAGINGHDGCLDIHVRDLPSLLNYFDFFTMDGLRTRHFTKNKFPALGKNPTAEAKALMPAKRLDFTVSNQDGVLVESFTVRLWSTRGAQHTTKDDKSPLKAHLIGTAPPAGMTTEFSVPDPIDAVFTWVNGNDPRWQELVSQYRPAEEIDFDRYADNDELRFSIRSVRTHAPWVRNIFVFSNCAPPAWFKETENTKWVYHSDVAGEDVLPLFSSHAIETFLPLIEGLSEHFLYFNDDVFLMRPTRQSDFFTHDGKAISKFESYGRALEFIQGDEREEWQQAAANGARLMQDKFGIFPTRLHQHVPFAYRKSVFLDLLATFAPEIEETRRNRFRAASDLSVASYLYHHFALATDRGTAGSSSSFLVRVSNFQAFAKTVRAGLNYQFICINDGNNSHDNAAFKAFKSEYLARLFPFKIASEQSTLSENPDQATNAPSVNPALPTLTTSILTPPAPQDSPQL